MPELLLNLHMHTAYSDGSGSHTSIGRAAARSGLDVVMVTDHNVYVRGVDRYYPRDNNRQTLLLAGEEVHDRTRDPQKNHLLVLGAAREMSTFAPSPQGLIDQVRRAAGLSFIAHPFDPELRAFGEDDISWVDWSVSGFTGLELWNGFSELKSVIRSMAGAVFYAYFPRFVARGPLPATLARWDELLASRHEPVVAVGGSDAHALDIRRGPLRRTLFPYEFHFQAINTHLLVDEDLTGNLETDRKSVYTALKQGHAFIGYDLPGSTAGFRFTAQGRDVTASMGDEIRMGEGVTLQIRLPAPAECRLIHNGQVIRNWTGRPVCTHIANRPGIYRVEVYTQFLGRRRGWIFSNPIYVRG